VKFYRHTHSSKKFVFLTMLIKTVVVACIVAFLGLKSVEALAGANSGPGGIAGPGASQPQAYGFCTNM